MLNEIMKKFISGLIWDLVVLTCPNSHFHKVHIVFCIYRQVSSHDYSVIENKIKGIVKEKQTFERLVITKENLLKLFEVSFVFFCCSCQAECEKKGCDVIVLCYIQNSEGPDQTDI